MTQGAPFPPHFNPGNMTGHDTIHSGSGRDRSSKSNFRMSPYQSYDTRQTSPTRGQMQGAGYSVDLPPVASGSQIPFDGSDSATSPGAESDPYRSFPNTPADTSGAMSEELDEAVQVRTHNMCFFSGSWGSTRLSCTDPLSCRRGKSGKKTRKSRNGPTERGSLFNCRR